MAHWAEKGLDWLEQRGMNVTRLRWRLYQMQRKSEAAKEGPRLPQSMQWMAYRHKKCIRCGAINARDDRRCTECGARLPSMTTYRVMRLLGLTTPATSPVVVSTFLGVIAVVFVLMIGMQGVEGILRPTGYTTFVFGSFAPVFMYIPEYWWRILGFGLVHGGLLHIAFNGFALSQVGPIIEAQIARVRMLVLITVTQLGAAGATWWWYGVMNERWAQSTVGASGWLFGLIGFGIVYLRGAGGSAAMYRQSLIQWAIYGAIFGLIMPGINNAAHIGGFAAGALVALMPMTGRLQPRRYDTIWALAAVCCFVLWVLVLGGLAISIVSGWSPGGAPPD